MNSVSKIQRIPIYIACIVTIVVIPALMDPINLPKLWALTLGSGVCLALVFSEILKLWQESKRAIVVVSVTFVAALLMVSIASEQSIFRTVIGTWGRNNGVLTYLALLIIFISLASMKSDESAKYLIRALTFLGIFGVIYGLIQLVGADPFSWENPGNEIILTLGNSNFASAFLGLTAIATLTLFLQPKTHGFIRISLLISFVIQFFLTKQSDALQGLLILILGSTILIGLCITFSNQNKIKRFAIPWWGITFTIGVFGIIGLFGRGPLASFLNPSLFSLQDRFYHWVAGVNMFQDNMIFGVGIDSFGDYYRKYRVFEAVQLRGTAMSGTNNAHNVLVQIGATGGLVLLLAYLAIIVFTGYRGVVALKKNKDKVIVSGIFSIWISFQVQSFVSIDQIGLVVWGWASAGCLVCLSYIEPMEHGSKKTSKDKKHRLNAKRGNTFKIASIGIGFIPAFLLVPIIQNDLILRNQLVALVSSDSLENLRDNGYKVIKIAAKSNHPELRLNAMAYLKSAELYQNALFLGRMNTIDYPNSFESWNATAEIYEQLGQKKKAIRYRIKSIELDPLNEEIKEKLIQDQKD